MARKKQLLLVLWFGLGAAGVCAQTVTVHGRVEIARAASRNDKSKKAKAIEGRQRYAAVPETVVWLTPAPGSGVELDPPKPDTSGKAKLEQKNKTFEPHVLVVPAGSMVEFPNHDPFFHNVFSLFEGKRFDLGLYEAGSSRGVRFDRPGISYIFCNIHPDMSAVIITLATPLYAIAGVDGQISIADVPYGRYRLHMWSEGMGPENEKPLSREITIGEGAASLGAIRVPEVNGQHIAHKNKYGRDYDTPTPDSSVYEQQK
ncbi:MAG: hypothetical protein ACRD3Q_07930 [Terriglobales bacterium]